MLQCECYFCHKSFYVTKKNIINALRNTKDKCKYCNLKCSAQQKSKNHNKTVNCKQCDKEFIKLVNQIKKTKNNFCSKSCAGTYNSTHKTHGTRRSKVELWLEEQLIILYPNLHLDFNKKDAINSELDIYIPSLKLAFELNGIFHYEPIYGQDKLNKIQNNDNRKLQACADNGISFCIIDISSLSYFKPAKVQKYLDIIIKIIDDNIDSPSELESESKD